MNKRLTEIELRLSAIRTEAETEGADLDALNQEADNLIAEKRRIEGEIEKRKGILSKVAGGISGEGSPIVQPEPEERTFDRDSATYRSAFLKNARGIELSEVEKRAFSSVADSAGAVIPTQTANEIIKKVKDYAPLLGEVTLLNVAGNVRFAVEGNLADAKKHTENASITPDEEKLVEVNLTSHEITKLVQVSKTVATMSIDAFEAWLSDMLAEKVAEKANAYLVNGTGKDEPMGIESAAEWTEENSVEVAANASLTTANVLSLIALLDDAYDKNAKFVMSKKTLFTDFMPLQDNAKNKLVTNEGKNYFICGYPVVIVGNVDTHEAYLGDCKKVVANLSEQITVNSEFEIRTNSYLYLGSAMFDSKVALPDAFVKLRKATA